ncbi:hypothetical protein B0H11DRAFT_1935594 [Mycena galericulata]|nr:hypothetical protein B0H11DRAFT_1935594 [Mycena galericulata]
MSPLPSSCPPSNRALVHSARLPPFLEPPDFNGMQQIGSSVSGLILQTLPIEESPRRQQTDWDAPGTQITHPLILMSSIQCVRLDAREFRLYVTCQGFKQPSYIFIPAISSPRRPGESRTAGRISTQKKMLSYRYPDKEWIGPFLQPLSVTADAQSKIFASFHPRHAFHEEVPSVFCSKDADLPPKCRNKRTKMTEYPDPVSNGSRLPAQKEWETGAQGSSIFALLDEKILPDSEYAWSPGTSEEKKTLVHLAQPRVERPILRTRGERLTTDRTCRQPLAR